MSDKYILDEQGNPVKEDDLLKWGEWFEKNDKRLARDKVGDAFLSTVFLGIDHNFYEFNKPILFETMVFGGELNGEQERYYTKQQALEGHKKWLKLLEDKNQ